MKQHKGWRVSLLLAALLSMGFQCGAAHADEYDDLLTKWLNRSQSAPPLAPNDPDVAMQSSNTDANNQTYWTTMETSSPRNELWPDLLLGTKSGNITATYSRLGSLLAAYNSPSSTYYHNADVLAAVLSGYDFMSTYYASGVVGYDNWWDWQIGTPQQLNNAMASNLALLTSTRVNAMIAAIDYYMPDPTNRANLDGTASSTTETGANRLDKAFVAVLRGIIGKSSGKIAAGRDAISAVLQNVTTGDGFYADNSFVQHTHYPYVGGYGVPLIADIGKLYYILNGSSWPVTDPNYLAPYTWAMQSFVPYLYNGAMMDNQRGRQPSREYSGDHVTGRQVIGALAELAAVLPSSQASALQAVLAGEVNRDTTFLNPNLSYSSYFTPVPTAVAGVMSGVSAYDIALIKGFLNDPNIVAADEPAVTQVFPSTDRALQRRPGYAFALSTFDNKRIGAFEEGNGENLQGWWGGVGMTYLYNADLTQYDGNYWGTVDMTRQAGTTTDHTTNTPVDWHYYGNTKNHVGAAVLNGQFATSSMDFAMTNVTGSPLTGKKAWFLFGDRIVAVGAGITNSNGQNTETIVENRQLNANGDNTLTVNGTAQLATLGSTAAMSGTSWAHLAGSVAGADIGYVFPDQPVLSGLREARNGNWINVNSNTSTVTDAAVNANFLSLALGHGTNPSSAAYTYIVLPNRTASDTAAFAAANPITVIERSTNATAVSDSAQGVTGVVFWNDASKTVNIGGQPYLTSDHKAVVTLQQTGNDLQLAVADPTQANTGTINLVLNKSTAVVVSNDPAITITQTSPTTMLTVAVNGSAGKSYNAHLTLSNTATLAPTDDTYARDGTYANSNFGGATTMVVKQDGTGYARKSYMKFDLSSISGTITSAVMTLTPVSVGAVSGMVHNINQTASDSWTQGALTWNTAPTNGGLLASFSVPAVNTPVQIDLTSAANSVLSGDKLLSLEIESSTAYGSNGEVDYASKENGTAKYRPTLVVTAH